MMASPQITIQPPHGEVIEKDFGFTAKDIPVTGDPDLQSYRQEAWKDYLKLPMPSVKEEAWRRTDLHELPRDSLHLAQGADSGSLSDIPAEYLQPYLADQLAGKVVSLAQSASDYLTEVLQQQGVIFTDLLTAEKEHPDLLKQIEGQIVSSNEGRFSALSAALANQGLLLYIPRGVKVEAPFHSLLWGTGKATACFSHILIWLEEDSSATFIHESASKTERESSALHCGTVEIKVGAGANLHFIELQSWGEHVWNFTHERAVIERDGTIEWIFGSIGSHLTKTFLDLDLKDTGATGKMSGFYFTHHDQHLDHDTQQNHFAPHTTSDLLFKGAVQGKSRSVWQGMIYVAPGAEKADGYQVNRNLILSTDGRADSIPGLEILADDVRCSHGATVGKLDEEQIFYLLSRGIPQADAEKLIVEGFFDPIVQRIPFEGVRERFEIAIHEKMEGK